MASNHKNAFPFFVPNQILRSSTLNEYFAFLDEQTRLSRVRLWGCGIVDGLDFTCEDGVLAINPGVAVNADGWLVQVPERVEYRCGAEVSFSTLDFKGDNLRELAELGGSHVSMICFQDEDDALHAGLKQPVRLSERTLDGFVVALAFGKRPEYDSLCSHDLCDVNTSPQILEAWPVLIPQNEIKSLFQRLSPLSLYLAPRREPAIEGAHGDISSFGEQILTSVKSWKSLARDGITRISVFFNRYSVSVRNRLFSDSGELLVQFGKAGDRLDELKVDKHVWKEYIFSFFRDVVTALNEFIEEYNTFVDKHEYIPNNLPADHLTYLGPIGKRESEGKEVYRSVFKNAVDEEYRNDSKRLAAMLARVCAMIESVIIDGSLEWLSKQTFKLERVRTDGRLSSRPVPFYYDAGTDFYRLWNADNHYLDKSALEDKYQTATGSMCDDGVFFYPAAYQGKDLEIVRNELDTLSSQSRLAIDVSEARLNVVGSMQKDNATTLTEILKAITNNKKETTSVFFERIGKGSPAQGVTSLAGLLKGSLEDVSLFKSLSEGKSLSGESFRAILKVDIDNADVDTLAGKILDALDKKTVKVTKDRCAEALRDFFRTWRNRFIGTDEGVSPDEIGKAISMAPIRRGSRVFLFTVPQYDSDDAPRKVVSYSVLYRNQSEAVQKPSNGILLFRLRTETAENEDDASDFPDTINPYGEGRWDCKDDQIVFYPYYLEGGIAKRYVMAASDISCSVSDPDTLGYRIKEENGVPAVFVEMRQNGMAWVTLDININGKNLCHKTVTLVVDNPKWKVVPLTGLTLEPSFIEYFMNDHFPEITVKRTPKDATDADVLDWKPADHKIAEVRSMSPTVGLLNVKKIGTTDIVVTCPTYPSVSQTVKVHSSKIVFKMRGIGGSFFSPGKKVSPFQDKKKWAFDSGYELLICPFQDDGSNANYFIPNPGSFGACDFSCVSDDPTILKPEKVLIGPKETTPAYKLKMMAKNGPSRVTLSFRKGEIEIASEVIEFNIENEEWNKTHVASVEFDGNVPEVLYIGNPVKLKAKLNKEDPNKAKFFDESVSWDSGNDMVAKVDSLGNVRPVGPGTTTITVKSNDGGKTATAEVTVCTLSLAGVKVFRPLTLVEIIDSVTIKDQWAGGTGVTVFAQKDDGEQMIPVTDNDGVTIIENPDKKNQSARIQPGSKEGYPNVLIPWPSPGEPDVAYLAIKDNNTGAILYKTSIKLLIK